MTTRLPTGYRLVEVSDSRYEAWLDRVFSAFGYATVSDDAHLAGFLRSTHSQQHAIAVSDECRYLATAGAVDLDLVLPGGGTVDMAGVHGVTVDATARRQGVQRAMMAHLHRCAVEREVPIAGLPSSEWPIYERYGYGPAVWMDALTIEVRAAGWREDAPGCDLRAQRITDAEARDLSQKLYSRQASMTPGEVKPPVGYWERFVMDPAYCRLDAMLGLASHDAGIRHTVAVADRGLASYRVRADWTHHATPNNTLEITDFLATDAEAAAALWRHLLSVDLVTETRVSRVAVDDSLRWWVADARQLRPRRHDSLWLRPFDVPKLLETREWSGDGALSLTVHDQEGYAAGTFRLEIDAGRGSCKRTTSRADLEMNVAALGAILLGGTSAAGLARSGRIHVHDRRSAQFWDALATPERAPFFSYPF